MNRVSENYNFTLETPAAGPVLNSCGSKNKNTGTYTPWCGDYEPVEPGDDFVSKNQALAGKGSYPRTKIAPLIVPPAADLGYWKKNELCKYPRIVNRASQQDLYLSGYISSLGTENIKEDFSEVPVRNPGTYSTFNGDNISNMYAEESAKQYIAKKFYREDALAGVSGDVNSKFIQNAVEGGYKDPFMSRCTVPTTNINFVNPDMKNPCTWGCNPPLQNDAPVRTTDFTPVSSLSSCTQGCGESQNKLVENFEYPVQYEPRMNYPYGGTEVQTSPPQYPYYNEVVKEKTDVGGDFINKACGYNYSYSKHSLPNNKCVGQAQLGQDYINYNKNIGTQIIQPGLYYKSQILDPINSNIGISFNQQFQPQTASLAKNGDVTYTDYDASQYSGKNFIDYRVTGEELQNIYDPRYTGYSSNDRQYIDPMTGQPRFFYDDIDSVKRPSYIVRSNVDHIGDFDQTGAMKHGQLDFDYRQSANNEFHESTLDFRTDIQTRLAQKVYARTQQLREMPLSNTGRMRGR